MYPTTRHQSSQTSSHGRVALCRWCPTPIVRDPDGNWIHTSRSYTCRDRWGAVMSSTAEPIPPPPDDGGPQDAPGGGHHRAE